MQNITTTTNKEVFSASESRDMARLVFKRFGRDPDVARLAWNRLLQNNCDVEQFMELVNIDHNEHECSYSDGICMLK